MGGKWTQAGLINNRALWPDRLLLTTEDSGSIIHRRFYVWSKYFYCQLYRKAKIKAKEAGNDALLAAKSNTEAWEKFSIRR